MLTWWICNRQARIGRSEKNGVKQVSATEVISAGPEGIIPESVLEGYTQYYSAELSEKVVRGMTPPSCCARPLCRLKGAVAKQLPEKTMHKTRNLFGAKMAQKGSGFLILRYFFVQIAIAFLFCSCSFHYSAAQTRSCLFLHCRERYFGFFGFFRKSS